MFGKLKKISKTKKLPSRTKINFELLHHIFGYRYSISLLAGDSDNVWDNIELRIYPDPFSASFQIYSKK